YVEITNYGGIIVSIVVPDREGKLGDVLLGCKTVEDYIPNNGYLGEVTNFRIGTYLLYLSGGAVLTVLLAAVGAAAAFCRFSVSSLKKEE
ncbi:MAG: hypothetical protein II640_00615, partial [Lachnospiraceae bacterium]|nr:hypothetical protein [Lachnospiraceae bacterium]